MIFQCRKLREFSLIEQVLQFILHVLITRRFLRSQGADLQRQASQIITTACLSKEELLAVKREANHKFK